MRHLLGGRGDHSQPRVAIVGGGLAGLSAAYELRDKASVTIFEREDRLGGRVFSSQLPYGEHGGEFFLKSENGIRKLMLKLEIPRTKDITEWPAYFFRGRCASGHPGKVAKQLLAPQSASRIVKLFNLVRREEMPKTTQKFDQWLSAYLLGDKEAIGFVKMLLIGETCAPLDHISTRYGLECMDSFLNDEWYRIEGRSAGLVKELLGQSKAYLRVSVRVTRTKPTRGAVEVSWRKGGQQRSEIFQAAILTAPESEHLLGKPCQRHFHGYISVLLSYRADPRTKIRPDVDLRKGLYTDGPLNYIQLTQRRNAAYALRILIPNAGAKLQWKAGDTIAFCLKYLQPLMSEAEAYCDYSVKTWRFGLPCGGSPRPFNKIGRRIFLAGDRFAKWPSMDGAVASGRLAAKALWTSLRPKVNHRKY